MPMTRRENPDHVRFLTFSCHERLPLLGRPEIRDLFVDQLLRTQERHRFALVAWVVMPEHVHMLLRADAPESPVPEILRTLKDGFAKRLLMRWRDLNAPILRRLVDPRGVTRVWLRGGGHDRNIFTRRAFVEKFRYIHMNPVRRGLCGRSGDWAWSSARFYQRLPTFPVRITPHPWAAARVTLVGDPNGPSAVEETGSLRPQWEVVEAPPGLMEMLGRTRSEEGQKKG